MWALEKRRLKEFVFCDFCLKESEDVAKNATIPHGWRMKRVDNFERHKCRECRERRWDELRGKPLREDMTVVLDEVPDEEG